MPEYNLSISPTELVVIFKNMGNTIRWLGKMVAPNDKRDASKWCDFHGNHKYKTEDCIALKLEVAELLKHGHLKVLLTDKGKSTLQHKEQQNQVDREVKQPEPPQHTKTVNIISRGSEVNGVSHSAAKRHSRSAASTSSGPLHQAKSTSIQIISFTTFE